MGKRKEKAQLVLIEHDRRACGFKSISLFEGLIKYTRVMGDEIFPLSYALMALVPILKICVAFLLSLNMIP